MWNGRKTDSLAFGVEPGHAAPYRLRQARYHQLGADVAQFAQRRFQRRGRPSDFLDVGVFDGVSRRYIEANPGSEQVRYHAIDIYPFGEEFVYKHDDWTHHRIDLNQGLAGLDSNRFEIVVCEQVLEHLVDFRSCLADLARVLSPGGLLIIGVPIFPHGLHKFRQHVVPMLDRAFGVTKVRGHVQAFSKASFMREVRQCCKHMQIMNVRGFRIVSGGILRRLEFHRWWWRLNRQIGQLAPSLCIEMQVVLRKTEVTVFGGADSSSSAAHAETCYGVKPRRVAA